jgi:hypothetical protein
MLEQSHLFTGSTSNISFREKKYREGEVPHRAQTGGGHILPVCSFPYSHEWLNNHHFRGAPD